MSFDKNRPDFFDETIVNPNDFAVAHKIQTKVFSQRDPVDVANPEEYTENSNIRPWRVSFNIETSKVELVFEVKDLIQIGRSSQPDQPFDGIDLSPFNGYELGVSRFHAEISVRNEQIVIMDKGSANGTLLNEQKLKPDTSYLVRHGDKISLGNMPIHIYFLTPIFHTT